MLVYDHEEADTLILLHAADVSTRNPFSELHIYSPDTDVFLLTVYMYPNLCANVVFKTGNNENARNIPIRYVIYCGPGKNMHHFSLSSFIIRATSSPALHFLTDLKAKKSWERSTVEIREMNFNSLYFVTGNATNQSERNMLLL